MKVKAICYLAEFLQTRDKKDDSRSSGYGPILKSEKSTLKRNIKNIYDLAVLTRLNPLAAEFIYLATSAECTGQINRPTAVKGIDFVKRIKMMKFQYFCILCNFDGFLNLLVFLESLPNCATMPELFNWSASKVLSTNPTILTKRPPVATTFPSGMNTIIGHWYTWGIPSDLRSRPEQSHHLPGALLPRLLQAVYIVSNGCPYLPLYKKRRLSSLFMIVL